MNKKEILGLCEFLKLHGYENTDNISKFIFGLQQENKKLNGTIQTYDILLKSNIEENKQLKDNWNKLKEYLNYKSERAVGEDEYVYDEIYNEMQEIEGSDSNE